MSYASPIVRTTELEIPVPYCGKHDQGVPIWNEDRARSVPFIEGGQQVQDNRWMLKVRSYRFYRTAVMS